MATIALAVGTIAGCGHKQEQTPPPPDVTVTPVIQKDVPIQVQFVGTLDGNVNADIRARVQGVLQTQDYREGSFVKSGQLLFTIDPKPFEAAKLEAKGSLEQAKAALEKATADVNRYRPLVTRNAISKQELDNAIADQNKARAQVTTAKAQLEQADINLGYTRITSPLDGVSGEAKVRIGNLVGQAEPTLLTTVSSVDPIRMIFSISESTYLQYAERLKRLSEVDGGEAGPPLELVLANGQIHPYKGRLAFADRQVNPATGTVTLQAFFPNPDLILRPGQYARVRAIAETRRGALLVPQRSIQEIQGKRQLAVVGPDDKIDIRQVTTGQTAGPFIIVDQGVQLGERVVVDGVQKARPGIRVVTRPADLGAVGATSAQVEVPPSGGSAVPTATATEPGQPSPGSAPAR